jgi:predicted nucleic acid-binding protein
VGALTLPASGLVYADAQITIYSADAHPVYAPACRPLWQSTAITVVTSELTLLEVLVGPLRHGDAALAARRENLWRQPNTRMLPVTPDVLREAARLRAAHGGLKTPDAIHAATALLHSCVLFVTNDAGSKRVPGLPLVLLDEVIAAP